MSETRFQRQHKQRANPTLQHKIHLILFTSPASVLKALAIADIFRRKSDYTLESWRAIKAFFMTQKSLEKQLTAKTRADCG